MRLEGKIVLITGAGSGIGRALAVELSGLGARLLLVGRRMVALEETREMLLRPQMGSVLLADITDPAARDELVQKISTLGRLDLLVNNAGMIVSGPVTAEGAEERRRMVDTNLLAPMELTLALLPWLKAGAPSRIVNIGSMFGDIAFPYFSAYSATKFGLRGWSDGLRRELAPMGIGVTYAAPRGTRTPAADSFATLAQAFAMRLDPPELVAGQIADAIAADARVAYPKGIERLFVLLQRLVPGIIDHALGKQMTRAADRLTKSGPGLARG